MTSRFEALWARNALRQPPSPHLYAGLSYADASRKGAALIAAAKESGFWLHLPEHLTELRSIMLHRKAA